MNESPTLRQIAQQAGLSAAGVSQALRGNPRIPEPTRQRVREIANAMGWRPNPLVSAYQARVRALHPPTHTATIAWVNDHENNVWRDRGLYMGAVERATSLGFRLEAIHVPEVRFDQLEQGAARIRRILRSRGITGVIMPELRVPSLACEDWSEFAVLILGQFRTFVRRAKVSRRREVDFHEVASDTYQNLRIALEELTRRGRKRIGFVITQWFDLCTDQLATARFMIHASGQEFAQRVPILHLRELSSRVPLEFRRWVREHRPDAILCANEEVRDWVRQLHIDVPGEVSLAHFAIIFTERRWSGMDICEDRLGAAAVEVLSAQVLRYETGPPSGPRVISLPGVWVDGDTA